MIHTCTSQCTHQGVPDLGGVIVQRPAVGDWTEAQPRLAEHFPGQRIDYLGMDAEYAYFTWRVGGKAWKPMPRNEDAAEGKQAKREIKKDYRPEVWAGSGQPVGPIDFSRPAEVEEQSYPAPLLTSDDPAPGPAFPTVTGLLALAVSRGWTGTITHAEGCPPHASWGTPLAVQKSQAVRVRRGAAQARAVRMGDKWTSLWTWSPTQFFTRYATLDAFREALR